MIKMRKKTKIGKMNKFIVQNDFLFYLTSQPRIEKLNLKEEALQNLSKAALLLDELKMYKTAESITKMMEKTASEIS